MTDPYQWATSRCARKECCPQEIAHTLANKGITPNEIESLITRLKDESYLNTQRYARAFVTDKFRFDRWGRLKISAALRQKGLDEATIHEAISTQIPNDDYRRLILSLIASRKTATQASTTYAKNQKVARHLLQRGFEPNLVFSLLNIDEEQTEE